MQAWSDWRCLDCFAVSATFGVERQFARVDPRNCMTRDLASNGRNTRYFLGRLCYAKTGYVALRPRAARARRRASCGVSPLALRSGLPAPRRPVAPLPEKLTFRASVSQHAAWASVQHGFAPLLRGFFFASLFVLADALLCRTFGATGARRAASCLDVVALSVPSPSFSSCIATIGSPRRWSRRAGPCCRFATARPNPPRFIP